MSVGASRTTNWYHAAREDTVDAEIEGILHDQMGWLWYRCRHLAERIVKPDGPDDWDAWAVVAKLTPELNQAVLTRFVERAKKGWFDQQPIVARAAQVRILLQYCVLQEGKERFRQLGIDERLVTSWYDDDDEEVDPLEHIEDKEAPSALTRMVDSEERTAVVRHALRLENPSRLLALVGLHAADLVTHDHFVAASRRVAGGKRFLVRDPEEAWQLFQGARTHECADDPAWWRHTFAEIVRFHTPLGDAPEPLVLKAVNALEKQVERAAKDVKAAMGSTTEAAS
jgi:hypothetical protein